jgi:hypothetical protein
MVEAKIRENAFRLSLQPQDHPYVMGGGMVPMPTEISRTDKSTLNLIQEDEP